MLFEHLIEVNDPALIGATMISHRQLWHGLILRAEAPDLFMEGIEQVNIIERSEGALIREIQLGNLRVRDHIRFESNIAVHYETLPGENHGGGTLVMRIEAPEPERLFVRFTYETPLPDTGDSEDAKLSGYVKSAYREMDIDTIRCIREMVEQGDLPDGASH